ncbi:MAG TPA: hypothetical protein VKG86_05895 [Terracidiphilus sp.]|nr:hypothetical protein [Terracidiphilus sp.]
METQKLCAYNQTRECFLGLEVSAVDIPYTNLKELIAGLALQSGEGLWISPFRGIPDSGVFTPLDLVYLDEECRVIDVVESFPTFRVTPLSPQAASVLALPTHSIYSSQTQPGDQLMLCAAEEMERRLEGFSGAGIAGTVQSAVLLREQPLWSGGPGLLQLKERPNTDDEDEDQEEIPETEQTHEMDLVEPGTKEFRPPKNWLERWWSPDPRKAPRVSAPGLAAYYWTGTVADARDVKDISSTGLYVVTEERWYPGTLILMTLQRTDDGEKSTEHAISVHSRAVRWGKDGVGLQFVLRNSEPPDPKKGPPINAVSKKELEKFLEQLQRGKG